MMDQARDDSPEGFRLTRRALITGAGVLIGVASVGNMALAAPPDEATPDLFGSFMSLSRLLIQHTLDPDVGKRLAIAMQKANHELPRQISELLAVAKKKKAVVVEDFFDDIPEGELKRTALAIISAWYMGVVVDLPDNEVFAYEYALMYQPTLDVMTIPSYAISGPNGWKATAPPLSDMPDF